MRKPKKINHLIENQAIIHANQVSVSFADSCLTYAKLNAKANQLAHYLIQKGLKSGDLVPIVAEKSLNVTIAILAILKAGAAYVPLNGTLSSDKIDAILVDTTARYIFISDPVHRHFKNTSVDIIDIDNLTSCLTGYSEQNVVDINYINDNAYVIYTSGTTGAPKGVVVTHHNLIQTYYSWEKIYTLSSHDNHLQMASMGFDVFTGDWVRALCSGGKLVLCPKEILLKPKQLYALMIRENITIAEFVPAVLRRLLDFLHENHFKLKTFRLLVCGSDQWTVGEYRYTKSFCEPHARVINSYGLTEATIDSTYFEETDKTNALPDTALVPIGKPFPHVKIEIRNEALQSLIPGEVGEICILGEGVASGYLNLPEKTAERFVLDPNNFATMLYRTGDQGYYLSDGNVAFLGRNQTQIKVQGERIELVPIEAVISQHPKIKQAILVPEMINNKISLNCFVVLTNNTLTYEELIQYLKRYHIQHHYLLKKLCVVNEIALTENGKVDRKTISSKLVREIIPQNILNEKIPAPLEAQILNIWCQILGENRINLDDRFYEVGGSSLSFIAMLEKVNQQFNLQLKADIKTTTVRTLASDINLLNKLTFKAEKPAHRIAVIGGGPAAVSFCIQFYEEFKAQMLAGHIEIWVFEKGDTIGPGLPYSAKENCYILNLPKEVMEPVFGKKGFFTAWLKAMPDVSQDTAFPPRHYFGKYLAYVAQRVKSDASSIGITIKYFTNTEITDVHKVESDQFQLMANSKSCVVDQVVLCTGHMPATIYSEFIGKKGYYHNPWRQSAYEINPNEDVAIVGTRLTAIDVASRLQHNFHRGKIFMFSRSGLLPAVLSREVPLYTLRHLTLNNFYHLTKSGLNSLGLPDLMELFWKEINDAEKHPYSFGSIVKSYRDMSPREWLDTQIHRAEVGPKPWQQVLFSLYPIIPNIWSMLNLADQKIFLNTYYSTYMTYLAAFPLENAYKMRRLLQSGQLEIQGDLIGIHYENNQFMVRAGDSKVIATKHLYNATGPGYDATKMPIYKRMVERGVVCKHPLGGVDVDPQTLQVLDRKGNPQKKMFAVGELTRGTCLATTDMTRLAFQTGKVSVGMVNNLRGQATSTHQFFSGSLLQKNSLHTRTELKENVKGNNFPKKSCITETRNSRVVQIKNCISLIKLYR